MKNKIIIILGLTLFLNVKLFSQAIGFEGKRFSADLTIGESISNRLLPMYTGDVSVNETTLSIYRYSILPSFRINSTINYTLTRKISIGLILSGSRMSFAPIDREDYEPILLSFGKANYFGIGIKLSRFNSDFISPVGSSTSIYLKYNTVSAKNFTYGINNSFSQVGDFGSIHSSTLKMNYLTIGLGWDKMSFLSKKLPIYLKYGVNIGVTFKRTYKIGEGETEYNREEFGDFGYEIGGGNQLSLHHQFSNHYGLFELVEFNFGIGYIFGK